MFYLVLRCARAIVNDNDILDRCAVTYHYRLAHLCLCAVHI